MHKHISGSQENKQENPKYNLGTSSINPNNLMISNMCHYTCFKTTTMQPSIKINGLNKYIMCYYTCFGTHRSLRVNRVFETFFGCLVPSSPTKSLDDVLQLYALVPETHPIKDKN